ncbi:hypothetical protein A2313_00440 [Candidatus Roizmanbacteria bacterium RIFOXYB2_FULL_41_10]|uniref:Uncharacterized protein n=1 Tax=Candidatus Roizmanbacteria bacterium RIFOXYA1_FULL_41_12 TaxID=1802082 RepID=A0A1F7KAK0_9BACT|nr:MAG: hypothetical protein A2262_01440 [Candidatus Roizmanbacteria bacterium RIFOXYA2_FULL_41_8]OGK64889.1 MAG: hypothetical protein A2209_04280 [Candidatus Roizmanbacteria bacterium RIFOXYA1_FULL_41_12]OGK66850.1 MAG: hypothetical protein A2377_03045 [Candidatus Roizmanbacteria bacterium RIFOXYB1_FULL_41_27]OGK70776.1 MAG: hypothetical protein A2403_01660 [Candidatus Roizmanbacteria bacterium RIFOXYC1_FULL_41_16]OGK71432.1 MAG: hypothetical protein A2313_00440 [Candidatus Roizmanbacteria bac
MYAIVVVVLFVSFFLAVWSMKKEQGTTELQELSKKYRQSKIKGGILIEKGEPPKHYSSYS